MTDSNGLPVPGAQVTFAPVSGSIPVTIAGASAVTDAYGIAYASITMGAKEGVWAVNGCVNQCGFRNSPQTRFSGVARARPTIFNGGIVNAAAATPFSPVAPGSYIAIYGNG